MGDTKFNKLHLLIYDMIDLIVINIIITYLVLLHYTLTVLLVPVEPKTKLAFFFLNCISCHTKKKKKKVNTYVESLLLPLRGQHIPLLMLFSCDHIIKTFIWTIPIILLTI
jgi:hypothetical protein